MAPSSPNWQETTALIIGRAYPEPSRRHIETVCTGAITEDGTLFRLYPVSLRYLNENQQYKLWTWVSFEARKSEDDNRRESYKVREESIRVLREVSGASERYSLIKRAISHSREALEVEYKERWTSMGIIPIRIADVSLTVKQEHEQQLQTRLDVEILPLDGFPIDLRVTYFCRENPECPGHESTIIAWEYAEAFRKFKKQYGGEVAAAETLKSAFSKRFIETDKDVFALVGTHSRYPTWMIGQLYSFDNSTPEMLF
jgi:hypothetical protein